MRTATSGELALLASGFYQVHLAVEIEDASAVLRDYSDQGGINWIDGVVIDHDIDRNAAAGTITLKRHVGPASGNLSLSPLRDDSIFNDGASPIDVGRRALIWLACTAIGGIPATEDWKLLFSGVIDDMSFAESVMRLDCRDDGGWLVDGRWEVKEGRTYATPKDLEDVLQELVSNYANLSGFAPQTVWTPESPDYVITSFGWDADESVMASLQRLVQDTIAWDLRYRWRDAAQAFQLALIDPGREKTTPDFTLGVSQVIGLRDLSLGRASVRNHITTYYGGSANTTVFRSAADSASIGRYGLRKLIIREADGSPIKTVETADRLNAAILSDLKDPKADHEAELYFFWPVELHDLARFTANNQHYNTDQDLAVVGIRHTITPSTARTQLKTRGTPAGGYRTWIARAKLGTQPAPDAALGNILRVADTVSADTRKRIFTLTVGGLVESVHVHTRVVALDAPGDVFSFADDATDATTIVASRSTDGLIRFSVTMPPRGKRLVGRMVPYTEALGEGESWPFAVDAAPPAVNAIIRPIRIGAVGSLAVELGFGESDGPVQAQIIQDNGTTSTTLVNRLITAPTTLDATTDPALGSITVPRGRDRLLFRARMTDVHGIVYWSGPAFLGPPLFDLHAATSESPTDGTLTLDIADPDGALDPAGPFTFDVLRLGDVDTETPDTAPGGGATSGTYTKVVALLNHPVTVNVFAHLLDGTTRAMGSYTFDRNKVCDVVSLSSATDGSAAVVTAQFDSDAQTGSGAARYRTSTNGGSSWSGYTTFAIDATTRVGVATGITRSDGVPTLIEVQGKNAIDGNWGNAATCQIDRYDRPHLTARYEQLTETTGRIVWSADHYDSIEYSIDGTTVGTPASPIAVTLNSSVHNYVLTAISGSESINVTVSVPSLSVVGPSGFPTFGTLTNVMFSDTTNQLDLGWSLSAGGWAFDVYVKEGGGVFVKVARTAVDAVSYRFTSSYNLTLSESDPTVVIAFYVQAVYGSTLGPSSDPVSATYNYAP